MERHHEVLGVSPDADRSEIRRAYRALLKSHHPDQGGSREEFLRIREAYEHLTGEQAPKRRRADDVAGDEVTYDPDASGGTDPFEAGLAVRGEYLTLSLAGLVQRLDLSTLVDGPGRVPDVERTVAFFEVGNATDRTLRWLGRDRTSFIGDDGFMYDASNILRTEAGVLPGQWYGGDVDVGPHRALRSVVVAQEMPPDVVIEQVVYTQHVYEHATDQVLDTERYLFEIPRRIRDTLDQRPPGLD